MLVRRGALDAGLSAREATAQVEPHAHRFAAALRRRPPDAGGVAPCGAAARQVQRLRGVAERRQGEAPAPVAQRPAGRRRARELSRRRARDHAGRCSTPASDPTIRTSRRERASRIAEIWDCTKRGARCGCRATTTPTATGSHVAGIIAGRGTADKTDYLGLAPDAELVVYKVLDDNGQGEDAWIIKALDHIAEQNDNIARARDPRREPEPRRPFDSTVYGCGFSPICQELRRLWRIGVLVVVACGNEGQLEVQTPRRRRRAQLADVDRRPGQPRRLHRGRLGQRRPAAPLRRLVVLVARAHGRRPLQARCRRARRTHRLVQRTRSTGRRGCYRDESGTSMAAPHVSGLLAAFLSVRREFRGRPDEVKKLLLTPAPTSAATASTRAGASRT